jgi:hypothetical protein
MEKHKPSENALSRPLIGLMKGVLFKENDPKVFHELLETQILIRDYIRVLGLDLVVDEAEGFAWLKTRVPEEGEEPLPRLILKRQLSYPVSLIIAILRKKLAENDASGGDSRLILSLEEIADTVKVFLPGGVNEARLVDKIDAHLNKIADMGFVRRLKVQKDHIEVLRILKAFVDAQWLREFDQRLQIYRDQIKEENEI